MHAGRCRGGGESGARRCRKRGRARRRRLRAGDALERTSLPVLRLHAFRPAPAEAVRQEEAEHWHQLGGAPSGRQQRQGGALRLFPVAAGTARHAARRRRCPPGRAVSLAAGAGRSQGAHRRRRRTCRRSASRRRDVRPARAQPDRDEADGDREGRSTRSHGGRRVRESRLGADCRRLDDWRVVGDMEDDRLREVRHARDDRGARGGRRAVRREDRRRQRRADAQGAPCAGRVKDAYVVRDVRGRPRQPAACRDARCERGRTAAGLCGASCGACRGLGRLLRRERDRRS